MCKMLKLPMTCKVISGQIFIKTFMNHFYESRQHRSETLSDERFSKNTQILELT